MAYNPRMGQLGSSGPSGHSISDLIQRARNMVHGSISPSTVMDTMWRGGPFAPAAGMASQGDVLDGHKGFFSNMPSSGPPMDTSGFDTPPAVGPAWLGQGGGYNPRMGQFGGRPPASAAPPVQPLDDAPQRGVPQAPPSLPWAGFGGPGLPAQAQVPAAPAQAPAAPVAAAPSSPPVPMPRSRPAEAQPAQPDTSFFMRNALSMRDPSTGELIDPSGAQSVRGPDLISKMMTYLHNKA